MEKDTPSFFKAYRFRILSGILFLVFLISTWFVLYQKPKYPEALHISLQEQLKQIIHATLQKQKPLAQNLQFQKMWTEATRKKHQIKAFFQYSFEDKEGVRLSVKGQATMIRKTVDDTHDLWRVHHIQTNNTKMAFPEPFLLFSDKFKDPEGETTENIDTENTNTENINTDTENTNTENINTDTENIDTENTNTGTENTNTENINTDTENTNTENINTDTENTNPEGEADLGNNTKAGHADPDNR